MEQCRGLSRVDAAAGSEMPDFLLDVGCGPVETRVLVLGWHDAMVPKGLAARVSVHILCKLICWRGSVGIRYHAVAAPCVEVAARRDPGRRAVSVCRSHDTGRRENVIVHHIQLIQKAWGCHWRAPTWYHGTVPWYKLRVADTLVHGTMVQSVTDMGLTR